MEEKLGGIEKMCRLTYHLNHVLHLYKTHSHGPLDLPEVQKALSRLDGLLSHRKDWKEEIKTAETWSFHDP